MQRHTILLITALTCLWAASASAVAIFGACCQPNGVCEEQTVDACAAGGGEYIGDGTSCVDIACERPVTAPMLSLAGLVAGLGALGGLGVYRLTLGRRS